MTEYTVGLRKFYHLNSFLQQLLSVWSQSKSNVTEILDSILDDRHLRINNKNPILDWSCCKWKATMPSLRRGENAVSDIVWCAFQ